MLPDVRRLRQLATVVGLKACGVGDEITNDQRKFREMIRTTPAEPIQYLTVCSFQLVGGHIWP